jgi:uncharacterized membrane protein
MKDEIISLVKRGSFYLLLYFFVILVCGGLISFFNLYPTSLDNERPLISSIIQSQATIISIVITLSLVAIQITASQYSSTIMDYIKRHPDFWILLTIYTISIFYGFLVLKTLNLESSFLGNPSDKYISLEFGIAIYSLIVLIPY